MPLPTKDAAAALLHQHVRDEYQRHHALMVATAMEGYAVHLFPRQPEGHPAQSPSASLQAAPAGATISALPRSVGDGARFGVCSSQTGTFAMSEPQEFAAKAMSRSSP